MNVEKYREFWESECWALMDMHPAESDPAERYFICRTDGSAGPLFEHEAEYRAVVQNMLAVAVPILDRPTPAEPTQERFRLPRRLRPR